MKLVRGLVLVVLALLVATPAQATSITVTVGDKDWFGAGAAGQVPGVDLGPWLGNPLEGLYDKRSAAEIGGTNGAHLTDIYSAVYYDYTAPGDSCSPLNNPGCTPNGETGTVIFPFSGALVSGSISMLMGDFECATWGAIVVNINGFSVPFCFQDGFRATVVRTFALTPDMIAAANLTGEVRLNLDHASGYDADGVWFGSTDYIAFDYFELRAEAVPEPATLVLLGLGMVGLAAWKRMRV